MRILVTGFGPFGKTVENPSAKLAEDCGQPFEVLRVSYDAAGEFLMGLDEDKFDVLLMLGVAKKREKMTPEMFGKNFRTASPDVDGFGVEGEIEPGAPLLMTSTLWVAPLVGELLGDERFELSTDAGDYLCNDITFRALRRFPKKRVGFLHVPTVDIMPIDQQQEALAFVLREIGQAWD